MSKINPYIIIIVVLLLIVAGFLYDKWGNNILPGSVKNPEGNGVDVEILESDITIGNDDASVTIVEYFSYFCGYCKRFHDDTYPKIFQDYISNGKVKYVWRVSPPFELGAAVLCANNQEKFLEYHNEIFENTADIQGADDLKTLAKNIGLNEDEFNQCFDSEESLAKAQGWYEQTDKDFEKAGVPENQRGTPSFFINNELVIGAQPYENFVEVIERKLAE